LLALERIGVARDPQPRDLLDHVAVAAVGVQPPVLGEDDRAGAREVALERVGVVVARDEHERLAGAHDPPHDPDLQRRAAVGHVTREQDGPARGGALEDRDRERVVVQVGGDGQPRGV
jgi:hypothetical protein